MIPLGGRGRDNTNRCRSPPHPDRLTQPNRDGVNKMSDRHKLSKRAKAKRLLSKLGYAASGVGVAAIAASGIHSAKSADQPLTLTKASPADVVSWHTSHSSHSSHSSHYSSS